MTIGSTVNEFGRSYVYMDINLCHLAISVAAGVALFLTSCGDNSTTASTGSISVTTTATPPGSAPARAASDQQVVVQGYKFPPITAAAGSTLTLVNRDLEPHTVTADDGSFGSKPFSASKSAALTVPTSPGSYAFHCKIHPTMHGTLVVQ